MQWTSGCFPIGTGSLIRDVQAYRREYLRKGMEIVMKVLWLCNIALPVIARELHLEASNKEGWLSGLAGILQEKREENGIELSVAFPMQGGDFPAGQVIASMACYGFPEDVGHPDKYDQTLEPVLKKIVDKVEPDLVHCFGTEYPHTLAMCRVFPRKERLLVGLQGLCTLYAEAYFADLPKQVIDSVTLRDWLRQDSLRQQQEKFVCRGRQERESIRLAGNVSGRTRWDRESAAEWNERACYYAMNETLRPEFYGPVWEAEGCIPHSIFLSQGDYPVKGLHYMLLAMPAILERYPDAQLYVAGNSLVADGTWKERLKRSAYGRYLRRLMREGSLEGKVVFLGKMSAEQMRDRYLKSSLFVCPSSLENSPNSLGEAMLLGMPCVCAAVGGIPSIFTGGQDGIAYKGFVMPGAEPESPAGTGCGKREGPGPGWGERTYGGNRAEKDAGELERIAACLAGAVVEMWDNPEKQRVYCENARNRAAKTHDRIQNYIRLTEIYADIITKA